MIFNQTTQWMGVTTLLAMTMLVGACGGSSSSSEEATSSESAAEGSALSRGPITGFGSVYCNGIKFRTENAAFSVDDDDGFESELKVGMIVTIRGSIDDDGINGQASSITYDNELKGPVSAITVDPQDATRKLLMILGQSVEINANTTIDDDNGLTFVNIAINDVLEVSGFVTDSGLIATHIELQDDDLEIEIKGEIENLMADSFEIRGFPVSYDNATELDDIVELANGLFVEVEGELDSAGTTLLAKKIEGEEEGFGDDVDEAEIEGVIYDYNAAEATFKIQGQLVNAADAQLFPASLTLDDGVTVEAEGRLVDGVLVAGEIEQKGRKIKIAAELSAVTSESISFRFNSTDILVRVNRQTELEDDINDTDISLSQLVAGNFVEMEAFDDGSGVINAIEIELKSPDEVRIVAPVESLDASAQTLELLGVSFDLTAATFENEDEQDISSADFFALLGEGVFVKIKDDDGNGIFEKAELDD